MAVRSGREWARLQGITVVGVDEIDRPAGRRLLTLVDQLDASCQPMLRFGPEARGGDADHHVPLVWQGV